MSNKQYEFPKPSDGISNPKALPDQGGRFGKFGGKIVPEALVANIEETADAYEKCRNDQEFLSELNYLQKNYNGRPSPLYKTRNLDLNGCQIYLKREDLNHTGSHKINNVLGQILLAKKMGKTRIIAETGAGQHGVATATACALFGLKCVVYMGKIDTDRQSLNVARMKLLGAEVVPVTTGSATLKDAINHALRDWISNSKDTYYCFGTAAGPHPFPLLVRDFQRIIGLEAKYQILEAEGRLPDAIVACVGGGSNAIGIFHNFIDDPNVRLIGCEAGGDGVETDKHAATISGGKPGNFQGAFSYLLQDNDGQITESHSISAGLDYPGVGPEHSHLFDIKRAEYIAITDTQAMEAFSLLSKAEGIIPAIESAHAIAGAIEISKEKPDQLIIVNLSGRGDKDVETAAKWFNIL